MYKYSYDSSSEGSDSGSQPRPSNKTLDFVSSYLNSETLAKYLENTEEHFGKRREVIDTLLLADNSIETIFGGISKFTSLKTLDLSNNQIAALPEAMSQLPLTTLIVKNNCLTNDGLPKSFKKFHNLKMCNFSGNQLSRFPRQLLETRNLEYLYLGNNRITELPKEIDVFQRLKVLCLGGNYLSEIPNAVGNLVSLQGLILSDNALETLPSTIADLKNLKSLLLHKNRLRALPTEIIALKCLSELSLRENPLVVNFVSDMLHNPPSLLELAGRTIKLYNIEIPDGELPMTLRNYLKSAHHCVNPKCKGVFFDNRVEHIKFVDFCGKYRLPLLQYLCSSKCVVNNSAIHGSYADNAMMRKVLLG